MPMFRKKPSEIQARQVRDDLAVDIAQWCGGRIITEIDPTDESKTFSAINVPTLHGVARASEGDWVIQGEQGDFWPCKHHVFLETYEPA